MRSWIARAVAPILVAVVLWFDTIAPAGAAVPVLYVAPILLFIRNGRFWEPLLVASAATVATLAVAVLNHVAPSTAETLNLPLELTMIWLSGTSVAYHRWANERWTREIDRVNVARRQAEASLLKQESLTRLGELAAVVAHEVRNPLAGLRGMLEVIETRHEPASRDRTIIRTMIDRIDALNAKVTDLLRYAKPREPVLEPIEIGPVVAEAVETAYGQLPGPRPHVSLPGEPQLVLADPEMLRASLLNLLLNAHQAGAKQVEIRTVARGGRCGIQVLDDGCGLPADGLDHIFDAFYTTKTTGTGLGLPIVKRFMALQNGTVSLEPRPGGGTIAAITLPLAERQRRAS